MVKWQGLRELLSLVRVKFGVRFGVRLGLDFG